jgi:5-methylcytosine-specific restriction endonuclease McrA
MRQALNKTVLILNKHWMAIHICTVRRAISLLYQGLARVVTENYQVHDFNSWCDLSRYAADNVVHTPNYPIMIPEVILLCHYGKFPRYYVKFNRRNIYQRDHFTCQYCGQKLPREALTIDHIIPRSRGGKTNWTNVVLACSPCNAKKGNRLIKECRMNLLSEPREPHWSVIMRHSMAKEDHCLWKKFIDVAYWNVSLEEE